MPRRVSRIVFDVLRDSVIIGATMSIAMGLGEQAFCNARNAVQTKEALRGCHGAGASGCWFSPRGHGGDWHAKPSTHPLPSKSEIRISRFVASARLHPWIAAGFQAAPASRPREPGRRHVQIRAWGFQRAVCSINRLPNAITNILLQSTGLPEGVVIYTTCF